MTQRLKINGLIKDEDADAFSALFPLIDGTVSMEEYTAPTVTQIEIHVMQHDSGNGFTANAVANGATISSGSAPTRERVLAAMGVNNKLAHKHQHYRKMFGTMYELVVIEAASNAAANRL